MMAKYEVLVIGITWKINITRQFTVKTERLEKPTHRTYHMLKPQTHEYTTS